MPWSDPTISGIAPLRPARISRQDAWQPAVVQSLSEPDPDSVQEQARRAAAEAAERELQQQVEAAWQNGREAGLQEARAAQQAETERIGMDARAHCDRLLKNLQEGLQSLEGQLADRILALALQFGEQIACRQLHSVPDSICDVLADAIQHLGRQYRCFDVNVHPEDAETVAHWLDLHHPGMTVKVVPDAAISRGGCVLNTGAMHVDASLETRIRRAYAGMGTEPAADAAGRTEASPAPSGTARETRQAQNARHEDVAASAETDVDAEDGRAP